MTRTHDPPRAPFAAWRWPASLHWLTPRVAPSGSGSASRPRMGQNAAAQRNYTWIQTTQMAYKGDVKSTTTSACQYVAGAQKPQCTQTSAPPPDEKQRGPVRPLGQGLEGRRAQGLHGQREDARRRSTCRRRQDLIQAAQGRGDVATAPNPSNGTLALTVNNYLQKGDAVIITVNQATHQVSPRGGQHLAQRPQRHGHARRGLHHAAERGQLRVDEDPHRHRQGSRRHDHRRELRAGRGAIAPKGASHDHDRIVARWRRRWRLLCGCAATAPRPGRRRKTGWRRSSGRWPRTPPSSAGTPGSRPPRWRSTAR